MSDWRFRKEQEFTAYVGFMLVSIYSGLYPEYRGYIDTSFDIPEEEIAQAFTKYTNTELTEQIQDEIEDGYLFSDLQDRLGISEPKSYKIIALDILNPDHAHDENHPEDTQELIENGRDFMNTTGWVGEVPPAWAGSIKGEPYIAFRYDIARQLLKGRSQTNRPSRIHAH